MTCLHDNYSDNFEMCEDCGANAIDVQLEEAKSATSASELRDIAIRWQDWASDQNLSWAEVATASNVFSKLGRKFKLTTEFKENGII